jgi:hypothetical protein
MSNEALSDRPWGSLKTYADHLVFIYLHWQYGVMIMLGTGFYSSLIGRPLDIANALSYFELGVQYPLMIGLSLAFTVRFTSKLWKMSLP